MKYLSIALLLLSVSMLSRAECDKDTREKAAERPENDEGTVMNLRWWPYGYGWHPPPHGGTPSLVAETSCCLVCLLLAGVGLLLLRIDIPVGHKKD